MANKHQIGEEEKQILESYRNKYLIIPERTDGRKKMLDEVIQLLKIIRPDYWDDTKKIRQYFTNNKKDKDDISDQKKKK